MAQERRQSLSDEDSGTAWQRHCLNHGGSADMQRQCLPAAKAAGDRRLLPAHRSPRTPTASLAASSVPPSCRIARKGGALCRGRQWTHKQMLQGTAKAARHRAKAVDTTEQRQGLTAAKAVRTRGKCIGIVTEAAKTQGKGSVLTTTAWRHTSNGSDLLPQR